jgi:hypothetical protein
MGRGNMVIIKTGKDGKIEIKKPTPEEIIIMAISSKEVKK